MAKSPTARYAALSVVTTCALAALGVGSALATPALPETTLPGAARHQPAAADPRLALEWSDTLPDGEIRPTFATGDLPPSDSDLPPVVLGADGSVPAGSAEAVPQAQTLAGTPWFVRPVAGAATSEFGMRFHPILRFPRMHNGVDMTAACGTPVAAAAAGVVTFVGPNGGYGNLVVVDHGLIQGARMQTKYAHLASIDVRAGDTVAPGRQVGLAGTTGLSTGCHLHFEVKLNGVYVDPAAFLNGAPSVTPSLPATTYQAGTPTVLDGATIKARIRFCESSNNYRATNSTSTASGAYQFIDGTWRMIPESVRGTAPRALFASVAEQDAAFDWLYSREGTRPWLASMACWASATTMSVAVVDPGVPTPTPVPSSTATPAPTATPTPSATPTPEPTPTPTPTPEFTPTPTPTPEFTPTPTPTPTPEFTPTPTPTPEFTPTPTPTPTPTLTPTPTPTPTP